MMAVYDQPDSEMTMAGATDPEALARAVSTLNAHSHRGHSSWRPWVEGCPDGPLVIGPDEYEWFTAFEALAIAEKYERMERQNAVNARPSE